MKVRIPATTANMGPGFDCIGMAMDLYNEIDFEKVDMPGYMELTVSGEGVEGVSLKEDNLIYQAYQQTFLYAKEPVCGIKMHFTNNIPFARGLGSSSAAIIGGIVVANSLLPAPLSKAEMLKIAMTFENHPDNVAPALLGGIVLSGLADGEVFYRQMVPPEDLCCHLLIPEYQLATAQARAALPSQIPLADAVFNVSRMGLLVDALHRGDLAQLALAMEDRLHQPYRQELIVGMEEITELAKSLGALNVVISGAGPTLLIVSPKGCDFTPLLPLLEAKGAKGRLLALQPVLQGALLE